MANVNENETDICRICNLYFNKQILVELFTIEVELNYKLENIIFETNLPETGFLQVPINCCNICLIKSDNFFKAIKNADISLKTIFKDDNLISEKDEVLFEIVSCENYLDSISENDEDEDYKPNISNRTKLKQKDDKEFIKLSENSRVTRSSIKRSSFDDTEDLIIKKILNGEHARQGNNNCSTSTSLKIEKNEMNIDYSGDDNSVAFLDDEINNDSASSSEEDYDDPISFCSYCHETVDNYKDHKKLFHNGRRHPYGCVVCRNSYPTAYALFEHQFRMHRPYVGGECDICKQSYDNLAQHNLKRHERVLCFQCGKTFETKKQFSSHVLSYHTNLNHFCKICNKGFKKPHNLKSHLQLHDEKYKIKCATCGKEFFGKNRLKVHEQTHIVERKSLIPDSVETITTEKHNFKCPFCVLSFICLESLQKHTTTHRIEEKNSEIYKHVCEFCSQRFKRSDHKTIHEDAVHRKILPFKCDTCGLKFVKQNFLTYHIKKAHSGIKHPCNMCQKSFALASTLKRHQKHLHFGMAVCNCSVCGKEMKNTRQLLVHLKTHTYDEEKEAAERVYEELLSKKKTAKQDDLLKKT